MFTRLRSTLPALLATALAATACAAPRDLDLTLQHPSAHGKFVVRMEPPADGPVVNRMQAWQVHVNAADGTPVSHASITVDGGMPQHGHGLPTRPRVTRELAPGVYALEGMKLSMTGWWELRLAVQAGDASDTAAFNLMLSDTGLQRGATR